MTAPRSYPRPDTWPEHWPGDEQLLRHGVRIARPRHAPRAPRWSAVMDVFGVGRTMADALCRRFEIDPDEEVKRR